MNCYINLHILIITYIILYTQILSQPNPNLNNTNSINDISKFRSIDGIQLYFFNDNTMFVYITINNKDTSVLSITNNIYINIPISNIQGYYFALGYGSSAMPDLDCVICGRNSLSNDICEGYITKGYGLYKKPSISISVKSYEYNDISSMSSMSLLYKTHIRIEYSLNSITSESLERIYSGKERFSFAYGQLIDDFPSKHINVTVNIYSIDGNSINNHLIIEENSIFANNKKVINKNLVQVPDKYYFVNEKILIEYINIICIVLLLILQ